MPNMNEIERAMTYVEDHPEKHKQSSWICGTGACLAGHAALLNGYESIYDSGELIVKKNTEAAAKIKAMVLQARENHSYVPEEALLAVGAEKVRDVVVSLFDIDDSTAKHLFSGTNTAETLRLMVKDIANGEKLADHWSVAVDDEGRVLVDHHGNPQLERLPEGATVRRELASWDV